ncbi:MAG: pyridoxamine 5'-phosphate oxidase family protein [Acidimicrobiales bacterium]
MTGNVTNYEDVRPFTLDETEQHDLLMRQNECTFVWSTRDGWPVGVTMSYVWRDGKVWLTSSRQRKRVTAVARDPRVSVIVSGAGTSLGPGKTVTLKGRCVLQDDADTKDWFYPALARAIFADDEVRQGRFVALLDSPGRVIFEVTPVASITHDVTKLARSASRTRRATPQSANQTVG